MNNLTPLDRDILTCDDNVRTIGQRTTQRIKGLATHNHRMTRGNTLEIAQILRDVPQQRVLISDYSVLGYSNDYTYLHTFSINSLERHRCFDCRVGIVFLEGKVLISEVEHRLHIRIQTHRRQ